MKVRQLIISFVAVGIFAMAMFAQVDTPFRDDPDEMQRDNRGRIIARALGLTEDQRKQIQAINQRQRELLGVAQLRLQTARAAADLAIYEDVLSESDVAARVQEVAMAQAEITKVHLLSEVAVRNVLSADQVVKFRALRARFAEQRRNASERRRVEQRRQNQQRRENPPPTDRPATRPPR